MEKIQQKLASLRNDVEKANASADAWEDSCKQLKQENTNQEREISSLTNQNDRLKQELEQANEQIQQLKLLEQIQTKQEHDIISLENQNKQLQQDLEQAHEEMEQLKSLQYEVDALKKENIEVQGKIILLEQELETAETAIRDTTKNLREADVKAEHFERKVQQLEITSSDQEKENEKLTQEIADLKRQLDEINASLENI